MPEKIIQLNAQQRELIAETARTANKPWADVLNEALNAYAKSFGLPAGTSDKGESTRIQQFLDQMHAEGILVDTKPLPAEAEIDNREPITVDGPPLSETIIAERR